MLAGGGVALGLLRALHGLVERGRDLRHALPKLSMAPALISDSSTRLFNQAEIDLFAELPQAGEALLAFACAVPRAPR